MPICGFNERMIQGISSFLEGLEHQALIRAKEESCSIPELLEKIELPELRETLKILPAKNIDNAYLGIAYLAHDMYDYVFKGLKNHADFNDLCKQYREETIARLLATEDKYYKVLYPKYGGVESIRRLWE